MSICSKLAWNNLTTLDWEVNYLAAQVKRTYTVLVLDIDDPDNQSMLRTAPLLMQIVTNRLLNPFDKVKVTSYEVAHTAGKEVQAIPICKQVPVSQFLQQRMLRPPVQARNFTIASTSPILTVPLMIHYTQKRPLVVAILAIGLESQERIYEERIQLKDVPFEIGMIIEAEVCQLEEGRMEYEVKSQGREIKYYLSNGFKEGEIGGHELGQHRYWVKFIRPSQYTANVGDISSLKLSSRLAPGQQELEYERLLNTSAIYAMESLKYTCWSNRATSVSARVHLKQETSRQTAADLYFFIPYQGRYQNDKRVFQARVKYWEIGKTMRVETPSTSARLYRSRVKMTICGKEIDENDSIWLQGNMDNDQVRVALMQVPALMRNNDAR